MRWRESYRKEASRGSRKGEHWFVYAVGVYFCNRFFFFDNKKK